VEDSSGARMRSKNLGHPDSVRPLGRGTGAFVDVAGTVVGRAVLEPGWRWSADVKPLVGTPSCEVHHLQMVVSGVLGIRLDDGEEREFGPDEVVDVPAGHDAWVVGDEPLVLVDVSGNVSNFALPPSRSRTVVTMLMTDIVDSTGTVSRIGDAAWKQRLAGHNRIVRRHLDLFGGREIDTTGDGFLAVFGSAEAALRAALAIQAAVSEADVEIRAGVHTGEVELHEQGLGGIEVHAATRIMSEAPAGTVFASSVTRALAGSSGLRFQTAGMHRLKGFPDPVELFRVDGSAHGAADG
jgi:class 3 adenylate cyclase